MKLSIFVLFCVISLKVFCQDDSQRDLIPLYDSIDTYFYHTEVNSWGLNVKSKDFEFNDRGDLLRQTNYIKINGAWTGEERYTYTYDNASRKLTSLTESYSFGIDKWVNESKDSNTYNALGYNTNTLSQKWSSDQWVNKDETIRIFDSSGNLIEYNVYSYENFYPHYYREFRVYNSFNLITLQVKYQFPSLDLPYDSTVYYYDNQGILISKVYKFITEFGENDSVIYTYSYNQAGYVDTILLQGFDNSGSLEDRSLDTFTYDEQGHQLTHLIQYESSGIWKDQKLESRIYNNEGYLLNQLGEFKSWGIGNWWKDWEYKYQYNENNLKISKTHFSYDSYDHSIHSGDSSVYYIQGVLGMQETTDEEEIIVFPNPSSGKFIIETNIFLKDIRVYNSSGLQVYYLSEGRMIDIEKLPPGLYFLTATDGNKHFSQKILKL